MSALKVYRANCHCKAHVLEANIPEIESLEECNCSSCAKRGALWAFTREVNFVKGADTALDIYKFGEFNYAFCLTCGTTLFVTRHDSDGRVGINARAIQNIDIWELKRTTLDGASMSPAYSSPKFTGPEPQGELADSRIFTGSCHCGAFKVAAKCKSLEDASSGGGPAYECNCSICRRNASIGLWVKNELVSVEGLENLTRYSFGFGIFSRSFCKICGVPCANKAKDLPEAAIAAMPEGAKVWYIKGVENWNLMGRTFDDFEYDAAKLQRNDGWNFIEPMYENP
ncbi:glutathione-dependent formaldehyde-activating enzyme [Xylariaceae sp. FL0255]|nr:glutathione-dependent formaldehyde-activating enzyme [Xylariaceae sp. FL0255]